MSAPIDFYFDFASPYGYFASLRIDAVAMRHGREVRWRPFMLGPAFKVSGNAPLLHQPLKGDYARRDWDRLARRNGVPFKLPTGFPGAALAASRAFYWLADSDPGLAKSFAGCILHAYFGEGREVTAPAAVAAEAAPLGIDSAALIAAVENPAWKQRLKDETAAAMARGVFGSPFIFVDDEPFWGHDRLATVEEWLESGGW